MNDRSLERVDPDWRLYVSDFPADQWSPNGWVSARTHVQPTARVKVEQQADRHGPLIWIGFGPHCQLFVPRAVALKLSERLSAVLDERIVDPFSAGVSEDIASPTSLSGLSGPAPAETPTYGV